MLLEVLWCSESSLCCVNVILICGMLIVYDCGIQTVALNELLMVVLP